MERRDQVILTNMCMIRDGSKVLVEEKTGRGVKGIIFPGGHVEKDEPIVDSVIREVREETGLTIEDPKLCGIKDFIDGDMRYFVFLFTAEKFSGTLTSSAEGRVFWVELEDIPSMQTIWDTDLLLPIFAEGAYTELFMNAADGWKPVMK